jgi:DNA replication protein DnaC
MTAMQNIQSQYNYEEVLEWLQKKGIELFGNSFKFHEEDNYVLYKLLAYFLKDDQACARFGVDLEKGILLSGPIGCGKTTLMTIMKCLPSAERKYSLKTCREVSFEFIQDGYEVIHRYSKGQLYQANPRNICFDDLGIENNLKYYGNECNVMAEVMLNRYDMFVSKQLVTHVTTNLSASEIEAAYGNRVRSRFRQMFNLIAFNKDTKDKR